MRKIFLYVLIYLMHISLVSAVEVNGATEQQLVQIKGIGNKTAQLIIQERQRAGDFISVEDFSVRVKGMGKKKVERLLQQGLHVNGQTSFLKKASGVNAGGQASSGRMVSDKKAEQVAEGKVLYVRPRQANSP